MDEGRLKEIETLCDTCFCSHDNETMCPPFEVRPTGRPLWKLEKEIRKELIVEVRRFRKMIKSMNEHGQHLENENKQLRTEVEKLKRCGNCIHWYDRMEKCKFQSEEGMRLRHDRCTNKGNWDFCRY